MAGIKTYIGKDFFLLISDGLNSLLKKQDKFKFTFETIEFENEEALEHKIATALDDKICMAFVFNNWDKKNADFNVTTRYATIIVPSTNVDPYSNLQVAPNLVAWDQWRTSGALQFEQVIAEAAMYTQPEFIPLTGVNIGVIPYKSKPFIDLPEQISGQLSLVFPLYFMFTFLLPLFYMISKLGEEKESKSREGMKMMGLND